MHRNREWIIAAIAHSQGEAVPYNFMFSPTAWSLLAEHFGAHNLDEALALPMRMTTPWSVKPLYASPAEYGPTITDEFQVVWSTNSIDRGSPIGPPLTEADLSGYIFPDPANERRFADIGHWCEANTENFTAIWVGDLWERATFMRGMENILLDVVLNPLFVEELLRNLADYVLRTMEILFERFKFDAIALSDDYGTQKAMIMSPDDWRTLIKPLLAGIYALAHKHNRYVFHHSCGNIVPIISDLIEIGLDILHPIQPEAMDIGDLKRQFGRELTFCGGLRTQDLLPFGTPEQVRREVVRLKKQMGAGGGFILEPGITVQADVRLENILAMIEQAKA